MFARQARHLRIGALDHLLRNAEADRVLRFPGIVADEAEHDPDRAQHDEAELLDRVVTARRIECHGVVGIGVGGRLRRHVGEVSRGARSLVERAVGKEKGSRSCLYR